MSAAQGALFWGLLKYPAVFRWEKGLWDIRKGDGQGRRQDADSQAGAAIMKPSEAKPVSGERFWLVRNRITAKETAMSMILNTPVSHTRDRFTLERASTKDKHQTAGKAKRTSPSPCAGRWRCSVNPCLSYQKRREKRKAPEVSVNIYLLG